MSTTTATTTTATTGAFGQGALQAGRLLRRWSRSPLVFVQALVFPVCLLLVFRLVFGSTVAASSGGDSLNRFVPLATLVGTVFGGVGSGASLIRERQSGLLDRFRAMPVHRSSLLIGRLEAELARALVTAAAFLAVGYALGFRAHGDLGAAALPLFLAVPLLLGLGFAALVCAVAAHARSTAVLSGLSMLFTLMLFFNTGFAPADSYPGALRPLVRALPLSCGADAMRGLADAGAVRAPLLGTVAWTVGLVAVFGVIAVRGLSRPARGDRT
ncbi:putative ABC transporter membrane protein [Actinacidiphila reveromycinica]|uniref:Transport permease protein n=1 Tax=Actinacidiphila reveromycinica TaxID=659352 RepID=A0A7U3V0U4_9ACTN|nr:ABC transporter permease [Streptomyces sp. SN-593]BBB02293.1 putative ABC transporter membrane protein [Streptomyces sp. SN-593]